MSHLATVRNQDRLRVLVADSTSLGTQLLVDALGRTGQFLMIEVPPIEALIFAWTKREKPDVAVISARLGENGRGAFDLVRNIRAQVAGTRVVMMIDASECGTVVDAFRAGVRGVFCRTEPFHLLAKCIQCVYMDQIWASSSQLNFLLDALSQPTFTNFRGTECCPLSAREIDVVRCVAEGLTNREIGKRLQLTEHTVKNYLFRIFEKLGASSRVEVVLYALGSGCRPDRNSSHCVPFGGSGRTPRTSAVTVGMHRTVT